MLASTNLFQTQDCPQDVEENEVDQTTEEEDADVEECGNQLEDESGNGDVNEAEESNGANVDQSDEIAPSKTGISADEAQAIAEAANPGASTLFVEFDREGGKDIWEVELNNGLDVQVDATSGEILNTEPRN